MVQLAASTICMVINGIVSESLTILRSYEISVNDLRSKMMKATIIQAPFGILAFDGNNNIVAHVLFSKDPEAAAKAIIEMESGKLSKEILEMITSLREKGFTIFIFENPILAEAVKEAVKVNVEFSKSTMAGEIFRSSMDRYAVELGFVKDYEDLRRWVHAFTIELTKHKVKRAVEKRDLLVAQAIQALDDLDKTTNLFMSRLREWYGIHFPELDRLLEKHETYARLVLNIGVRSQYTLEGLIKEGLPSPKAKQVYEAAQDSMGADLSDGDLMQIQALARNILALYELRDQLEKYIDEAMEGVAPNIKAVTGSLLGARLIALAGSLENLAKMPASTIQVLGAEKALFRSLKTGSRPPKHGIIFQHPYLHDAKKWQRGKIARAMAGKIAIAARADLFGGRFIGDELRAELEKRVEEIKEKYAEPPVKAPAKPSIKKHAKKERGKRKHAR
ncbi:MAG: C/D box methylation guide ribonucleoprotein complex aNOP56 subunit [Candidatus Bathyarchaeia archaeon]